MISGPIQYLSSTFAAAAQGTYLYMYSRLQFLCSNFQQALASGGFPIAVPLQTNTLNTGTQGGMTVNG